MRPITREIIDRRQPVMRWSAVFAGALVSVSLWVLLQMLGMGIGLAAIHVDDAGSLQDVGIGTTVWTLVAPFVAMFIGGALAGRLAGSRERTVGSLHGLVMWAVTSLVGILATVATVSMLAAGALHADVDPSQLVSIQPDAANATDATSKILLAAGISQLIALATAVLGGAAGVRRRDRRVVELDASPPVAVAPEVAP